MQGRPLLVPSLLLVLAFASLPALAQVPIDLDGALPREAAINPVTNEIWVSSTEDDRVLVVDGATHAVESIPVGDRPRGVHVDPVRNQIWIDHESPLVTVIDGESRTAASLALPTTTGLALDPRLGRVYAPLPSGLALIDPVTLAVTVIPAPLGTVAVDASNDGAVLLAYESAGPRSVVHRVLGDPPAIVDTIALPEYSHLVARGPAVDARTSRVIVGAFSSTPVVVDWSAGSVEFVPDFFGYGSYGPVPEPTAERVWLPSTVGLGYGVLLHVFDPATLAQQAPPVSVPDFDLVAVNPATRRAFTDSVADFGSSSTSVTMVDGATLATTTLPIAGYSSTRHPVVNTATSRVYVLALRTLTTISDLIEIEEPTAVPVPLDVAITLDPIIPGLAPVARFAAASGFAPSPLPIRQIYWQVDGTRGRWAHSDAPGPIASATLEGLAPGSHTLHAFATDGQEVTASRLPTTTPIVGPISSISFTVPPPPACSNGIDDDGDGLTDYPSDRGCASALAQREDPACDDGIDNDGDALVDHPADPECVARWDGDEAGGADAVCGLGFEIALALGFASVTRRRSSRCLPRTESPTRT
jgi:YVTN family beta-propeller protein